MMNSRHLLFALFMAAVFALGGCASLRRSEPVQVVMVGVEPLQGEGLELRMLLKLRIQNPNELPVDFTGVFVEMDVQGKRFASGVSDVGGSVPRYGETIVTVPVSISAFSIARQTLGMMANEHRGKLAYELKGKLAGSVFSSVRFQSTGEFTLPTVVLDNEQSGDQ